MRHGVTIGGLLIGFAAVAAPAQDHGCGTHVSRLEAWQMAQRQQDGFYQLPLATDRSTIHVRVKWHILRDGDGTGGLSPDELPSMLEAMNTAFEPVGIQFCDEEQIDYIDDSNWHSNVSMAWQQIARSRKIV